MSTIDGFRPLSADEIRDNYDKILDLARQGKVFVRDDVKVSLPDCLMSPEALRLWKKLQKAGLVRDDYTTIGLSNARKAVLASIMAKRLGIYNVWKEFSECWNCDRKTLRSAYNKALCQNNMLDFIDKIQRIFRNID